VSAIHWLNNLGRGFLSLRNVYALPFRSVSFFSISVFQPEFLGLGWNLRYLAGKCW
jgi:hypothetical protein